MGAGLKLDRPLGWRRWDVTWRLLAFTMPLSILAGALLGSHLLGLGPAAALLLGAVLAPTDPVLVSEVQVGPPRIGGEDDVRFGLTSGRARPPDPLSRGAVAWEEPGRARHTGHALLARRRLPRAGWRRGDQAGSRPLSRW
jgi:hypothetical protein